MSGFVKSVFDTRNQWGPRVGQAFKKMAFVFAGGLGAFAIAAMILWDADFYVARDRWETFKHAMFGDWSQIKACELTNEAAQRDCELAAALTDEFNENSDFHFFEFKDLPGTPHQVVTAKRYAEIADLLSDEPNFRWCFVQSTALGIRTIIDLVAQEPLGETVLTDDETLALYPLAQLKLTVSQLRKATTELCNIDLSNTVMESNKEFTKR